MFPSLPSDAGTSGEDRSRLLEFQGSGAQQQKGLMKGHAIWTALELDYIDKLRREYQRVFSWAAVALAADADDVAVGLHIISALLRLQWQLMAEERVSIARAVAASLASRRVPRPSQGEPSPLPFSSWISGHEIEVSSRHFRSWLFGSRRRLARRFVSQGSLRGCETAARQFLPVEERGSVDGGGTLASGGRRGSWHRAKMSLPEVFTGHRWRCLFRRRTTWSVTVAIAVPSDGRMPALAVSAAISA
ncbi:hypothetical protein TraAM80_05289 [Trypanosoma rangeli]|uniref:Uncharacterized protein n=1 Tax=Trypanosoma rangeli TaxID=5698 RepID=A0A422NFD1_TRYRA|nr:uncharacterized protein TraAM80_05289 [Trypanosoma rangeli]RNF04184.1 hypothetical protein TraAM80_05289 [Trypanosoma rangeli]|eukprot:RNF04184.1 hypothetical protein TraAM80_05289 [Trypanosoma rangeli]